MRRAGSRWTDGLAGIPASIAAGQHVVLPEAVPQLVAAPRLGVHRVVHAFLPTAS
ncbi:hypothetical protein T484DRAFT_1940242 [Baffinella frigidus]|nr:hypothetical protein T484DRAFT_1940242 [Cryptophyta sp. CCMP2293]